MICRMGFKPNAMESWAHILSEAAKLLGIDEAELLSKDEIAVLNGKANPERLIIEKTA
jgi:hypothetical protein